MSENRKILLRNAFLGKFDRSQMTEVDNAIAIVKEAKAETEKALEVSHVESNFAYSLIHGKCNLIVYSQQRKKMKYYGT